MPHLHFRVFIRCSCPKWLTVIRTFIHWWWWLPCKVPTSTSGGVWGSVSCPRTLRHADQGARTSYLRITRRWLYSWATAAHVSSIMEIFTQTQFKLSWWNMHLKINFSAIWNIKRKHRLVFTIHLTHHNTFPIVYIRCVFLKTDIKIREKKTVLNDRWKAIIVLSILSQIENGA